MQSNKTQCHGGCYSVVMKTFLPLFPLKLMLLPGEQTALHIFEERYRQLLSDTERLGIEFGIPYFDDEGGIRYGASVRLVEVSKRYDGGEADIIVEATRIFKVEEYSDKDPARLYPSGEVVFLNKYDNWPAGEEVRQELQALKETIGPKASALDKDEYRFVPYILRSLNLSHQQKYTFVSINNVVNQEKHLASLLKFSRLIVQQEQQIENGLFPN